MRKIGKGTGYWNSLCKNWKINRIFGWLDKGGLNNKSFSYVFLWKFCLEKVHCLNVNCKLAFDQKHLHIHNSINIIVFDMYTLLESFVWKRTKKRFAYLQLCPVIWIVLCGSAVKGWQHDTNSGESCPYTEPLWPL